MKDALTAKVPEHRHSVHKTKEVEFLQEHLRVRFHFTPTSSWWLDHVELWFAKIQRDVCARLVHLSAGCGQEAAEIYPRLLQVSQAVPLSLRSSQATNRCYYNKIAGKAY